MKGKIQLKWILLGTAIILAVLFGLNGYYNVNEQEQAVVTMFGKAVDVKTAGLYFKIPFVQQVQKVDTTTHGMQIGYTESADPYYQKAETVEYEALMITSDFNFVDIDFDLEYRVSDPEKYLYHSEKPIEVLRNLAQFWQPHQSVVITRDRCIRLNLNIKVMIVFY